MYVGNSRRQIRLQAFLNSTGQQAVVFLAQARGESQRREGGRAGLGDGAVPWPLIAAIIWAQTVNVQS